MNILKQISRILIGIVFIFSGAVKAIDPLGTAYKFHDYFQAFNLTFLDSLSLALSVLLCTAEFLGGFSVLTGIKQKLGIAIVLIMMVVFTPVTFILWLNNPVSDCGCFGEAVHLTNFQTFAKNVILLAAALILFINRKQVRDILSRSAEWSILALSAVIFLLFAFYNLKYLPVIDFLPYKKGVKIAEKMVIPEGAQPDVYQTTFIYEKEGIRKEFSLKDYPADDTTWKFIDQKSVLIRKGYTPPIHDFSIIAPDGTDLTQKILSSSEYTLLMVSKKLDEANGKDLSKGFELGRFCLQNGVDFYVLSASGSSASAKYDNSLNFCSADETTLKTMVRANPGFLLIRNGTIEGKWSLSGCPDKEWFAKLNGETGLQHGN
jgi:hypothetical protein